MIMIVKFGRSLNTGSSSRPQGQVYLLGKLESELSISKLPKTNAVLSIFLTYIENAGEMIAAQDTACRVK